MERQTGILIPISSLLGNQGIGDFGKHTYRLIDAISKQHIRHLADSATEPCRLWEFALPAVFHRTQGMKSTSVWIHWQITDCLSKALS